MVLRRLRDRIRRPSPDRDATYALVESLDQYSVQADAVSDERFLELARSAVAPPASRLVAAAELSDSAARYALLTRVAGQGAAHSGQLRAVGAHLLIERSDLSPEWPTEWRAALRAMPSDSDNDLGPVREFEWRSADATDSAAVAAADRLASNERVNRRVLGLLRDGSSGQFEIAPQGSRVRVAVYQYGVDLPDPTAIEALLSVAGTLTGAS